MASVTVSNIHKSFDDLEVIHGVSIDIDDGEFLVLVGPSGCGKSTLLRMIAGLEDINDGDIAIGDTIVNDMAPKARDVAMVFQNYALYPHMTVRQNMGFSLRLRREDKTLIRERVDSAAQILGLTQLLNRLPRQLSGGERQRVAMGRAIVRDPQVFLFDEPLSNLDAKLRVQMRTEIKALHQRLRTTSIYVTHDQVEAMTMAERIVVMNLGRVEQVGRPLDLYDRPANLFVAGFIGSPAMNLIEALGAAGSTAPAIAADDGTALPLPADVRVGEGQPLIYGIRPEDLALSPNGAGVEATVSVVEPTGSTTLVFCQMAGQEVCAEFKERHDFDPGETIRLMPRLETVHLFDRETGQRLSA